MFYELNNNMFLEEHMYKIKVKAFYKIVNTIDKDVNILFLSTHNQHAILAIYDLDNCPCYDISLYTKTNLKEINKQAEKINFNDINNYFEIKEVKKYEKEEFLEIYQNDCNDFITNVISYINRKSKIHIDINNFKVITKEESLIDLRKFAQKILTSKENLLENHGEKLNLSNEMIINIFKYPENIKLLYKVIIKEINENDTEKDSVNIIFIFSYDTEWFYTKNTYSVDKNKEMSMYNFEINNYEIRHINKINSKIKNVENFINIYKKATGAKLIKIFETITPTYIVKKSNKKILFNDITLEQNGFRTILSVNKDIFYETKINF